MARQLEDTIFAGIGSVALGLAAGLGTYALPNILQTTKEFL